MDERGDRQLHVRCGVPGLPRQRLKPIVLAVTIGGKNISDFCEMSIRDELNFIAENEPNLTEKQKQIGGQILKEIKNRLQFLQSVGLDYLTLARAAGTLSGGESQRIRLTTQIGSALSGVLYVLDEPSIGLHQRDNNKLIATLKNLRDSAIRSSWWSTTRIPCAVRIILWMWAPARASTAARSWRLAV